MLLLLALIAFALDRASRKLNLARELKWWKRPAVWLAILIAVLILATPEFSALGLLGDSAFFDLLVLLISLQLRAALVQARCSWVALLRGAVRWLRSPRMSYLLVMS